MADPKFRYDDNSDGKFYVDQDCIACDTCVGIAPKHFKLTPNFSHAVVYHQPISETDTESCMEALDACPVHAIGVLS